MNRLRFEYDANYGEERSSKAVHEITEDLETIDSILLEFVYFLQGVGFSRELIQQYMEYDDNTGKVYRIEKVDGLV